jgi:hypothetical protein
MIEEQGIEFRTLTLGEAQRNEQCERDNLICFPNFLLEVFVDVKL